jgi:hypothetical protein
MAKREKHLPGAFDNEPVFNFFETELGIVRHRVRGR